MRYLKNNHKRRQVLKLTAVYVTMVAAVALIVTFIVFFMIGYRFNADDGQIEQYAFLQFRTVPSGATVKVDGIELSSKTPTKTSIPAGKHEIIMERPGYEQWRKTISVNSGTITWLKYAILVPKKINIESVLPLGVVYESLASPERQAIITQEYVDKPIFNLIDLSSDNVKTVKITLPVEVYSTGNIHAFKMDKWDKGGRYVIVKHTYDSQEEWLVIDTQSENSAKNITKTMNLAISKLFFLGNGGNKFYILSSGEVKKIDISSASVSKPVVSATSDMVYCNETNDLAYIGTSNAQTVVGIYRDGDEKPHTLKTFSSDSVLRLAITHYFNEEYVAIIEGQSVDILGGGHSGSDMTAGLKTVASFDINEVAKRIEFSPGGEYLLIQTTGGFTSYDLEYKQLNNVRLAISDVDNLAWLNESYLYADINGTLSMREFDGTNIHSINPVSAGQGVALTSNNRYVYSLAKVGDAYHLQRVKLTLN